MADFPPKISPNQFHKIKLVYHSNKDFIDKAAKMKNKNAFQEEVILDSLLMRLSKFHFLNPTLIFTKKKSVRKKKKTEKSLCCFTTYSPLAHILKSTNLTHWLISASDQASAPHCRDTALFVHKRGPDLDNQLLWTNIEVGPKQAVFTPLNDGNNSSGPVLQHIEKLLFLEGVRDPATHFSVGLFTCSLENIIYLLKCPYDELHIGKTTRMLKQRISEHKDSIRCNEMNSPAARHFNEFSHPISSLRFRGIERIELQRGGDMERKKISKESFSGLTL